GNQARPVGQGVGSCTAFKGAKRGCIPYVGVTFSFQFRNYTRIFDAGAVMAFLSWLEYTGGQPDAAQPVADSSTSFTNRRKGPRPVMKRMSHRSSDIVRLGV